MKFVSQVDMGDLQTFSYDVLVLSELREGVATERLVVNPTRGTSQGPTPSAHIFWSTLYGKAHAGSGSRVCI